MDARRLYRVLRQFCSVSLLLCALVALVPASTGHAATLTVSQFYPATRAAYDSWNASTSNARPKKTTNLPASTAIVAFYFEYDGAKAKVTTYGITVSDATGTKMVSRGPYTVRYNDGLAMRYIPAPNGKAFPNGRYHADLLLNGTVRAGTDFVVGGSAVSITTFYAATKAAYNAWGATTDSPRPKQSNSFSPGSASIAFYFEYDHAVAKSSQYQITIRNQQGKMIVIHGPYAFTHDAGLHMSLIDGPGGHFDSGSYRADLLVDGQRATSAFFSVGGQPAAQTCSSADYIATCLEPSILRLHADLGNAEAEGTGFVIRADSTGTYLLTNKHVVEGATANKMVAYSPDGGTKYPVLAVLANKAEGGTAGDLAIVRLAPTSLRPLLWGNATTLHLLQPVISIGYGDAFNLPGPPTATQGSISALHRDLKDGFGPVWIQHQSPINHGNSGGPLLDSTYHVVGVNTLSFKDTQGIFFAIPADMAKQIADTLIGQLSTS